MPLLQQVMDFFRKSLQETFAQESLLIIMSVFFGGVITVIVNNGAMKKQSRFDMRRKILDELLQQSESFQKKLEHLEMGIAFKTLDDADYNAAANEVIRLSLNLNEALRTKRKFVVGYIRATTVEESAEIVSQINKALCEFGDGGFIDIRVKQTRDDKMVNALRALSSDANRLSKAITEALEKLSSPCLFARLFRLLRPIRLIAGEYWAIWRVGRKREKRNKKNK
jgi:hypothetical protein